MGDRAPGGPGWLPIGAGLLAVLLTLVKLRDVPVYLSADAGHYLADADAVLGNGVRESRHLPVFPLLLGVARFFVADVQAVTVALAVVMILLVVGFWVFLRGRLANTIAVATGTLFFVLSPVVAEGVGWYGGSMLLGMALSLVAMRLIDDAMSSPTLPRAALAGFVIGLVGLTHPLPFLLLGQVIVLVGAIIMGREFAAAYRAAGSFGRAAAAFGPRMRSELVVLVVVAGVVGIMTLPQKSFYTSIESPLALAFNPLRLATLGRWAFREDLAMWAAILVLSMLILVPGARRLNGEAGFRMGLWAIGLTAVPLASVVLADGHPSYTTRYLYALPLTLGCTVAVGIGLLTDPQRARPAGRRAVRLLVALAMCLSVVRIGQSYVRRLDVALPYYNTLTTQELEAVRWLRGRQGTVAVSPKGGDKVAGTLYAWQIEGLAHARAIGTDEAFLALIDEAHEDSLDIDRLMSGSTAMEDGRLRVSGSEGDLAPVELTGLIGGDWFSLASLYAGSLPDNAPPATVAVEAGGVPSRLEVHHSGLKVEASLAPTDPAAEVRLTVRRPEGSGFLSVDVRSPPYASSTLFRAQGRQASFERTIRGRRVAVEIAGGDGVVARVDNDDRTGSARLHLEAPEGSELPLTITIRGVDDTQGPIRAHRDVDLLRRHRVGYVFTWHESGLVPVLGQRRCFVRSFENSEVVIFAVRDVCLHKS